MTKAEREEREYKSLFTDERYAKRAWKQMIGKSLQSDAAILPAFYDVKVMFHLPKYIALRIIMYC